MTENDQRALLSTLWVFVLLNVLFRDVHEFLRPGVLEEIMMGALNGTALSESLLLIGGIVLELQLVLIVLSRIVSNSINRWINISVALLSIAYLVTAQRNDLDDTFFALVEITGLIAIIWLAWSLPRDINCTVSDVT